MSFKGYDFANGITGPQLEQIKSMSPGTLRELIGLVISQVNSEMKEFLMAERKWEGMNTRAALKDMRKALLRLGKLQRSFQIVRMEYLVAASREEYAGRGA